jgi:haloalkane dehalogenase
VTDAIRTPDVILDGLPGFDWAPSFRQWDGLRLAHVDVGEGAPVLMLHGEPTWSYLWRKVAGPVLEAGHRVILPDLPGFGRSDKPMDEDWYSYDRHTAAIGALLEELDLRDATFVLHDWGGPIGLRLAVEQPERVARLVLMDTGVFTGEQEMSAAWHRFADFVDREDELPVGFLVRRGCFNDPGDEVAAAYDAPFPSEASKAGARAFPAILPLSPSDPGAKAGRKVLDALQGDERPTLILWGAQDNPLPPSAGEALASELGKPAAPADRRRRPLPPGGQRSPDRRDHRGLARNLKRS